MSKEKTKPLTIRLPEKVWEALEKIAKSEKRTANNLASIIIEKEIKNLRNKHSQKLG